MENFAKSILKALGIIDETSSDIEAKIAEALTELHVLNLVRMFTSVELGYQGREEDAAEIAELDQTVRGNPSDNRVVLQLSIRLMHHMSTNTSIS